MKDRERRKTQPRPAASEYETREFADAPRCHPLQYEAADDGKSIVRRASATRWWRSGAPAACTVLAHPLSSRAEKGLVATLQRILDRLSKYKASEIVVTTIVYGLYAAVLGAGLAPSIVLLLLCLRTLIMPSLLAGGFPPLGNDVLFALAIAGSLYVFFYWALILIGLLVRVLSLGVKPGRHASVSAVTVLWLIISGIFIFPLRMILPMVTMTYFSETFFRLCGCRIGKGVRINTISVIDPYLVQIGDGTVIGGEAVLTPHVFESDHLYLAPITIGKNCLIGGHAYISPGVTIGDGSTIGLHSYIRKNKRIPPGSRITTLAGLSAREIYELERRGARLSGKRPLPPFGAEC